MFSNLYIKFLKVYRLTLGEMSNSKKVLENKIKLCNQVLAMAAEGKTLLTT